MEAGPKKPAEDHPWRVAEAASYDRWQERHLDMDAEIE